MLRRGLGFTVVLALSACGGGDGGGDGMVSGDDVTSGDATSGDATSGTTSGGTTTSTGTTSTGTTTSTGDGDGDGDGEDPLCGTGVLDPGEFCDLGTPGECNECAVEATGSDGTTRFVGELPEDVSAESIAGVGDVDGDGLGDLLIGAPGAGLGGAGYLVLSSAIMSVAEGSKVSLANASYRFEAENSGDLLGRFVAGAGDVDGDGRGDLLLGAPRGDSGGSDSGTTYLMLASAITSQPVGTTFSLADASYRFVGEAAGDRSSRGLASAGDVDGDGRDDILITAPGNEPLGTNYLLLASEILAQPAGASMDLADASYRFVSENTSAATFSNENAAGAGDVDGDGRDDILIGAPVAGQDGVVYLMLAADITAQPTGTSFDLAGASRRLLPENSADGVGTSVAAAGDVDGDGLGDVIISAPNNDTGGNNYGKTYLVLGADLASQPSGAETSLADAAYQFVGNIVSSGYSPITGIDLVGLGDIDGDGGDDILIGSRSGESYLMLAADITAQTPSTPEAVFQLGSDASATFVGARDDETGQTIAAPGDVNGDGRPDLLIGARTYDDGEPDDPNADDQGISYLVLSPY